MTRCFTLLTGVGRFGFIKYHNFEDAENCIRGFHYLGYEVSFARVRDHIVRRLRRSPRTNCD
jgi:RNA recognition motif-containing protein